jgi:anti-sigma factor RsiW
MNPCDEIRNRMDFYLDDELRDDERAAFEAHLKDCQACRNLLASEQQFLQSLRQASPLYKTPDHLRSSIEQILRGRAQPPASRLYRFVRGCAWQMGSAFGSSGHRRIAIFTAIGFVLLAGIFFLIKPGKESRIKSPSEFALMAVEIHLRHLRGQLPLEITSASPDDISKWFQGKVPFSLKLPNYQESSGQDKLYKLEGARLVNFKNDYAAYVAYQMQMRPISLVVTSDKVASPSGGEEIVSKGITFHYDSIDGLKVITWSDRGLTYALVSDLEERGQQSCIVCHQGTRDRD